MPFGCTFGKAAVRLDSVIEIRHHMRINPSLALARPMTSRRPAQMLPCLPRLLAASVAVAVVLVPLAAHAGFEIRGAGIPQAQPQSGGAIQSDSTLAPIGMMPDAAGQATIPVTAVPIDAPAPVDAAPLAVAQADGMLSGFGTDLPLVIALQQVAPPGYQFAFSPGVDLGQRVSWEGGKPWRDVAHDMLASKGLTFETQDDNVLMVMEQGASAPALQTAQVTPPAVPAAPSSVETADIRRKKPAGLISRIRSQLSREETPVEATIGAPPRNAAEQMTAEWDDAQNDVAASALNNDEQLATAPGEDLSPIALTMAPPATPPAAARAAAPVVRPPMSSRAVVSAPAASWQAEAGMTLRDVLQDWANRAGVDLYWSIDYDYRLRQSVSIDGTFSDAASQLLDRFANAKPRPYAQLHQQGGQARTLVVKAYGVGY